MGAIHWSERPDEPAQPLEVSAGALPAMAGSRGGAHFGMCGPEKIIKTDRAPTKIGEINAEGDTAYNMFTYGEGNTADSDISVAIKGKGPWQLSGSHHIGNSKQAEVRHEGGPGQSLWFTSGFDYHLVEDRCRQKVIVHQWRSGIEPHRQMNQGCTIDPYRHHAESYGPGSTFYRSESRAVTWTGAAEVYGASLTSRSGFSKHVHMALKFGQGSSHWLCGDNDVPPKSSRVFSGNSSPI